LVTKGGTALGPALAVAVGIASSVPRSEVIVCTDGLPNVGIGSLPSDPNFYKEIGDIAKSNNLSISIIGIEGASGAMPSLSVCSELSNGSVNLINPLELTRQMRAIIDNSSMALEVSLSIYFPPGFKQRNTTEEENNLENVLTVPIGNINSTSCYTIDFGVEDLSKIKENESVPLQVQIDYKKLNGTQYKRVEQLWINTSNNREEVEESCDTATLGLHAIRLAANQAYNNPKKSSYTLIAYQRLFDRVMSMDKMEEYSCFVSANEEMEPNINNIIKNGGGVSGNLVNILYKFKNSHKVNFLSSERKKVYIEKLKKHVGEAKQMSKLHDGTKN